MPRVILFCVIPLLNGQEDLKIEVFNQMKVKERQSENVVVPLLSYSHYCATLSQLAYLINWTTPNVVFG